MAKKGLGRVGADSPEGLCQSARAPSFRFRLGTIVLADLSTNPEPDTVNRSLTFFPCLDILCACKK